MSGGLEQGLSDPTSGVVSGGGVEEGYDWDLVLNGDGFSDDYIVENPTEFPPAEVDAAWARLGDEVSPPQPVEEPVYEIEEPIDIEGLVQGHSNIMANRGSLPRSEVESSCQHVWQNLQHYPVSVAIQAYDFDSPQVVGGNDDEFQQQFMAEMAAYTSGQLGQVTDYDKERYEAAMGLSRGYMMRDFHVTVSYRGDGSFATLPCPKMVAAAIDRFIPEFIKNMDRAAALHVLDWYQSKVTGRGFENNPQGRLEAMAWNMAYEILVPLAGNPKIAPRIRVKAIAMQKLGRQGLAS